MPNKQILLGLLIFFVMLGGCASKEKVHPYIDLEEINSKIIKPEGRASVLEEDTSPRDKDDRPGVKDLSLQTSGTNSFLDKLAPPAKSSVSAKSTVAVADGEGILLNFDNADIFEVIQVIAETLDLNYVIDPQVKGVVNLRSGKKIPMGQLFTIFKKILHINGLDIRSEGSYDYIYVSKNLSSQIINGPRQISDLREGSEVVIQVVPVMHLSSTEAAKLLEPYLSAQGAVHNLPNQNTLLIRDYESKVLDVLQLLFRLDISPLSSLKIRLVKVENAPLYDLRDELVEIFDAMHINKKDFEGVSLVPLERVNSLLLISKNESLLDSSQSWIAELDVVPSQDRDNIYIYNVRNSVASDLADLVNTLISEDEPKSRTSPDGRPDSKNKKSGQKNRQTASRKTVQSNAPLSSLRFAGAPMLLADDSRNIILIRSLPADYSRLIKLLERLDNMPRQVLVEVLVAEISLTNELEFGVEWAFHNKNLGINGSDYTQTMSTDFGVPTGGFSYNIIDHADNIVGMIHALATDNDLTILSSPQVLVLNNETATIDVGQEVPIVTTETYQDNSTVLGDAVDKTVEYRNTGVILEVTPKINYNGIIILDVSQEVSSAEENFTSGINSPIISIRKVKTKMAVKDGQSVLIGGLIRNETLTIESGVPFFKDIPWLGYMFKYQKDKKVKQELLIMITPYVIETEDVLDQYIREFKDKVQKLRAQMMDQPLEVSTEFSLEFDE